MFCKVRKTLKEYREFQLKFYTRAQDTLEQRLAGISAAKRKLEEQNRVISEENVQLNEKLNLLEENKEE